MAGLQRNFKLQSPKNRVTGTFWMLMFGASLDVGAWNLELLFLPLHVPMHEEIIHHTQHDHDSRQPERDAMILALHQRLVLTHLHAQPAQHRTPDRRAKDGEG